MPRLVAAIALALAGLVPGAEALASPPVRTVCTITVNSSDEADAFRRALPAGRYRFVELVEKGRPDWLAAACRQGVQCDVLVVSGHYDGEGMFFSDRVDAAEHLPVRELERAACSQRCPGLFERLQQVYLFGCHTLSAEAVKRSWHDFREPEASRIPAARHGESSRDRMARIFRHVPVVYGFAGVAPLGPVAGDVLARYFRAGGTAEVASGRASPRLLAHFAEHGLTSTRGIDDGDPRMAHHRDVCQFADDRRSLAQQAAFVHAVLQRDGTGIVTLLDPLEQFAARTEAAPPGDDALARALAAIRDDDAARDRFLAFARTGEDAALRARLVALAHRLGWLTPAQRGREWVALLGERLDRGARASDVDLACRLAAEGDLDGAAERFASSRASPVARDAMLACVGDEQARGAVLEALLRGRPDDAEIARALLEQRPIRDGEEFVRLTEAIAGASEGPAQARALEALARHPLPDARSADVLARLFSSARSVDVQRAIAAVLVRADLSALDGARLLQSLRDHRVRSGGARDMVDVLMRRLAAREQQASIR